ncbi:DegT/DnrJ/EryC1/StrS family aminotransferase [Treponema sp. J25]|uniref:DegT/DnrJ/EryC1/StrS family aminotransferase n=1 Tax=Treponema sp. J25 TaxID=2094121 RepID=UPI00104E20B1|nr:DegT/DnrJ/EryC1/StrS family aminotransferase [Treponema sp. J25]TCW60744.1 UDP-4-amino-4,6-dideoxy-N-acetyl-beta-L-altrosamine transaminase [Treponema sp. J25]
MNTKKDLSNEPLPFARPSIGPEEEAAVLRVLRSGWLTTGKETLAFEQEFASFLQRKEKGGSAPACSHTALAVNSATSGLHLALEACGVGPGDLVFVPTYTFTATAEVVRYLGAEVVFVDVIPGTYLMDPRALEESLERINKGKGPYELLREGQAVTEGPRGRPRAVIPVHFGGLGCDMGSIRSIARKYNLTVIEDAAHAFPSLLPDGSFLGTLGDAGVFSFYATKTITTGEGGMVVTGKPELAQRISIMRSHGIDRSVWHRYTDTKASWQYDVVAPGYKYNLPDILAAIGRVQLQRAWELLDRRRYIAHRYTEAFRDLPFVIIPPDGPENAWHLYPLRLAGTIGLQKRDEMIQRLQEQGIGVSVHFIPLHTMRYYAETYHLLPSDFPYAMDSFKRTISLPIWPDMSDQDIDRVIITVKKAGEELFR